MADRLMETPSLQETQTALAKVVRRKLIHGESVTLPGLGTLDVHHERSVVEKRASGETVLQPPNDRVLFTPDA